jgi:uncharacterized protein YciI
MPYLIITYDKPDHGRLRQQTRPEHLKFWSLTRQNCSLAELDDLGASASGGIYILDTEDRHEAESFIADDPFTKAKLFWRVEISRWRKAYFNFVNCLPSRNGLTEGPIWKQIDSITMTLLLSPRTA